MIKYPSIRRMGHEEVSGILEHGPVEVSEKLDGANARFSIDEEGKLICGSRNHHIVVDGQEFNGGLGTWADRHRHVLRGIITDASAHYGKRVVLVGEYMTKHKVNYGITNASVIFYDVLINDIPATAAQRNEMFDALSSAGMMVNWPLYYGELTPDSLVERFSELPSKLNPDVAMEGVVIKSDAFVNRYGRPCHMKMLNESFMEVKKAKSTQKANAIDYQPILRELVTEARIEKLIAVTDNVVTGDMRDMQWLPQVVTEDVLVEEILYIRSKVNVLDFKVFNKQVAGFCVTFIGKKMRENA